MTLAEVSGNGVEKELRGCLVFPGTIVILEKLVHPVVFNKSFVIVANIAMCAICLNVINSI